METKQMRMLMVCARHIERARNCNDAEMRKACRDEINEAVLRPESEVNRSFAAHLLEEDDAA